MYEDHHNCVFMNINEKYICVLGNQQYKNGCLPTKTHIRAVSCSKNDKN